MVRKIVAAVALMTLAGAVFASSEERGEDQDHMTKFRPTEHSEIVAKAPEIDPASAMAGLSLLAGGLAVLRGRMAKKTTE